MLLATLVLGRYLVTSKLGRVLAAIRDARDRLNEGKRFDMPGFRPNVYYLRHMQRYGILPDELKPDRPIDLYATDQAYWKSLWYRPSEDTAK